MNIMAKAVNVSIRIDEDVKKASEELFGDLGLTLSAAVNVFLRQALRYGGLPFEVRTDVPNAETLAAFEEAERLVKDPNTKRYKAEELIRELNS